MSSHAHDSRQQSPGAQLNGGAGSWGDAEHTEQDGPPSAGVIRLLPNGRLAAYAPRDATGRRKILGASGTVTAAQQAIIDHMTKGNSK